VERELAEGDAVYLAAGGHGLRTEEDTVLLALKQGPYGGPDALSSTRVSPALISTNLPTPAAVIS